MSTSSNLTTPPLDPMSQAILTTVQGLFASGAISLDTPDEAVLEVITKAYPHIRNDHGTQLAKLQREVEERFASRKGDVDEVAVRQIADSLFQSAYAAAAKANASTGTKTPLPALRTACSNFVENAATGRMELAIDTSRHAMVSGPSGSGKTYPIEQVLRKRGLRYITVSVADGMTLSDFVARANVRATSNGAETYYTHGFLPLCMLNGLTLVLDEVDQLQPEIAAILNKVMDGGELYIPQTGETIQAVAGFQVFLTCNTLRDSTGNYGGFRLSAALLNRVVFVKADYLTSAEETAILQRVGLSAKDSKMLVGVMQGLRAAYASGRLTQAPSTRIAVRIARCVLGQNDDGAKAANAMKLADAFCFCLIDGLPDAEAAEALACVQNGL